MLECIGRNPREGLNHCDTVAEPVNKSMIYRGWTELLYPTSKRLKKRLRWWRRGLSLKAHLCTYRVAVTIYIGRNLDN